MRVCDKRMNSLSDTCTDPARTFVTDNALLGQRSDGASTTSCCVFAAAGARAARRGKTQRRVETYFLQLVSLHKHTGFKNCKLKGQRHLEAFSGQQACWWCCTGSGCVAVWQYCNIPWLWTRGRSRGTFCNIAIICNTGTRVHLVLPWLLIPKLAARTVTFLFQTPPFAAYFSECSCDHVATAHSTTKMLAI